MPRTDHTSKLRISEIFFSLQGESRTAGIPTIFIRLTGCPLRCQYCDTSYAFQGGEWLAMDEIIGRIQRYHTKYITITGGEPLAQKNCLALLTALCDLDYNVSLETSGAIDIAAVDGRVSIVMDLKTPASGESDKNRLQNLHLLKAKDEIKFVICDRQDYEWARTLLEENRLIDICGVLFSPSAGQLEGRELADWIIQDQLPVRFQLQLHKILWGDEHGR